MDPFSIIAGAMAVGAAAGLKEAANKAVKEAYGGLSTVLKRTYQRYTNVTEAADHLVKKPTDKHRREGLEGELNEVGLQADPELVAAADKVLRVVESEDPGAGNAVGVDIGRLRSEALEFVNVNAPEHGTGVRIKEADIKGTASFKGIGGSPGQRSSTPK